MEPLALTFVGVARHHLAVANAVAVAVRRLVCIDVVIIVIVALQAAAVRIRLNDLGCDGLRHGTTLLMALLARPSVVRVPRRSRPCCLLKGRQRRSRRFARPTALCRHRYRGLRLWRHGLALVVRFVFAVLLSHGGWRPRATLWSVCLLLDRLRLQGDDGLLDGFGFIRGAWKTLIEDMSGVLGSLPLGLVDADDSALALPFGSALDCIEFCRARDDAGRGALLGIGDARACVFGSGRLPITGEDVTEGDMPFLNRHLLLLGLAAAGGEGLALLGPVWRRCPSRAARLSLGRGVSKDAAHGAFHGLSAVRSLFHLAALWRRVSIRSRSSDAQTDVGLCSFSRLAALGLLATFSLVPAGEVVGVRVVVLISLVSLRLNGLFPRIASSRSFLGEGLGGSRNGSGAVATCALGVSSLAVSVLWVGPVCGAAPFRLVAELALEVGPHVLDARELAVEGLIGSRYDVVFLLERHQHLLDFESRLSEELAARNIGGIEDAARSGRVGLVRRGAERTARPGPKPLELFCVLMGAEEDAPTPVALLDELEELVFRAKELGVDLLKQCKMSDELLGEGSDGVGEVRYCREDVDGLVARGT
ncbi:hypothetical protein ACCO45_005133 [Purpureocillium lilacinum]|uniref:Uncharacterized protein n=1 Tax=Purpureocillium lilacinum TaxID=33203 RepID=A0ACC4DUJ0_PURLI